MSETNHGIEPRQLGDGQVVAPDKARQGMETHHIRWVLAISLALGIVAVGASWAWYSGTSPASRSAGPETPPAAAQTK
jgi:hypothetical protein